MDVVANYFAPGWLGGDHSMKIGFKYRNDIAHTETTYGGDAYVRYYSAGLPAFTTPESAYIYRRGLHASTVCTTGTSTCRTATAGRS